MHSNGAYMYTPSVILQSQTLAFAQQRFGQVTPKRSKRATFALKVGTQPQEQKESAPFAVGVAPPLTQTQAPTS